MDIDHPPYGLFPVNNSGLSTCAKPFMARVVDDVAVPGKRK
jgi:hypothetical protein